MVSGIEAYESQDGSHYGCKNSCIADNEVHPFPAAASAVKGDSGLHSHTDSHGEHGKKHADFPCHSLGCQRGCAVAYHHPVGNHGGYAHQQRAAGKGEAQ